ncbi:type II secretion system minor pseudopilin GspH [Thalassotalea fusca]
MNRRKPYRYRITQLAGFTLIEVLLVIVVVGLMVAAVQFSFVGNKAESELQTESLRFAGIFETAAEYGLLNNVQLGLVVKENSYEFLGYDGTQWVAVPDNPAFEPYELPDGMALKVELEDLPIEEQSLYNRDTFAPEEESFLDSDDEKPIIPHVYILSGGDITPFSLTIYYSDQFDLDEDISYRIDGSYTTPVIVTGPYINGELAGG